MANNASSSQLKMLVWGKAGVGKSSLINSLVGSRVCPVHDPGIDDNGLDPGTLLLEETVADLPSGIKVRIFDSPGLQDGAGGTPDSGYVREMHSRCNDANLFLYCINMTLCRFLPTDERAIGLFTEIFGPEIWERCVVVLTQANIVKDRRTMNLTFDDQVQYHRRLFVNLQNKVRSVLLEKCHVSRTTCDNLRVVAAGNFDYDRAMNDDDPDRYIPFASMSSYESQRRGERPCDRPVDYITELWVTCLETLPQEFRFAYLQATARDGRVTQNGMVPTGTLGTILQAAQKIDREITTVPKQNDGNHRRPGINIDDRNLLQRLLRSFRKNNCVIL